MELTSDQMIFQGAEARVFEVTFLGRPTIVKQRFSKKYRIPELDKKLTLNRLRQEARAMLRSRKVGVFTPVLYLVDNQSSCLYMEKVQGKSVKQALSEGTLEEAAKQKLWKDIGQSVARLHDGGVIHGDITTSNMMIRDADQALVIIDFGLSTYSKLAEDKGVDLYVLERAITSAHPGLEEGFQQILEHYSEATKMWTSVNNKYREGLICVKDRMDAPAAFMVPHLLKETLQAGYKVLFFAVDHSVGHYERVLRKFLLPVASSVDLSRLVMVDLMAEGPLASFTQEGPQLRSIHDYMRRRMSDLNPGPHGGDEKMAVFVDCLSTVRSLCLDASLGDWISFVGYCRLLGGDGGAAFRLVTLVHRDVEDDGVWLNWLEHVADVTIASQPMELISIADVDGQVVVVHRGPSSRPEPGALTKKLYFRMKDSGVKFLSSIAIPV